MHLGTLKFHSSKDSLVKLFFSFFPVIFLKLNNCLDSFYRSIKFLNEWLQSMDYDINFLWHNITVSFSKVIYNILTVLAWPVKATSCFNPFNFKLLLAISILHQENRFWEIIKWLPKETSFDLKTNSPKWYNKKMY